MEQNDTVTTNELVIDSATAANLREAGKWAQFLAIVGFVTIGFIVLIAIFFLSLSSMLPIMLKGFGALFGIAYFIIAFIYFMPTLYFFRFATGAKAAVNNNDQQNLSAAIQNLKSCFKFIGILTIVLLSFYAIIFIVMGLFMPHGPKYPS